LALSTSLATSIPVAGVFCGVLNAPATATGASFTGVTVIEIVATFEFKLPSLALKVKLAGPLKFGAGVKLYAPVAGSVIVTVPCAALDGVTML